LLASGLSHQHNYNNLSELPLNTTKPVAMAAVGNLDRTLESIAKDRKPARNNKPRRAVPARTAKATVAIGKGPSNGIQKAKAGKPTKVVAAPAKRGGESKIQVSGLPEDVSDAMLKVC
jgi:THO complex subunit 4